MTFAKQTTRQLRPECTKIAHRRSLAIFAADEGIAGNSAARAIFTHFIRRRSRGSLAIFFAEEIVQLGASKNRAIFWGAVKIAAAAAENRAVLVHSGQDYSPTVHNIFRQRRRRISHESRSQGFSVSDEKESARP